MSPPDSTTLDAAAATAAAAAAAAAAAKSLQSCPTLCDPIDGSPPGSPVPGILQAKTLAFDLHKKNRKKMQKIFIFFAHYQINAAC